MDRITLYEYEDSNIKISMNTYFNANSQLIFEGYDIGKTVKGLRGDSQYEYYYTVDGRDVIKLAKLFNVDNFDRMAILIEIKKRFNGNDAYSKFGEYMKQNQIKFEAFSWP